MATATNSADFNCSYDGTTWTSITLPFSTYWATAIMGGLIDDGSSA